MKVIINFIRLIIALYLGALATIGMIFISDKTLEKSYPSIFGYSFYLVDNRYLEPEIPKSTLYVLIKESDQYSAQAGEYVLYKDSGQTMFKKIMESTGNEAMDEYLVGYPSDDPSSYTTVKKKAILFKGFYHSNWLSVCYSIFTNWIVIIVLFLFLILSPNMTYKRFEL